MANTKKPDMQLLFGVLGGGSLSGESGAKIKNQLENIMRELNKNPLKVKVELDTESSDQKSWGEQLKTKLNSITDAGKFSVKISKLEIGDEAISNFKKQLNAVVDTISLSKGMSVTIMSNGIGEVTGGLGEYTDAAREAAEVTGTLSDKTGGLGERTKENCSQLNKVNNALIRINNTIKNSSAARDGKTSKDFEKLEGSAKDLEKLRNELNANGQESIKDFDKQFSNAVANAKNAEEAMRAAGENTKTFGERVGTLAGKFSSWLTISQVIMKLYQALKQMVSAVIEVDTAMTELRKVTDETESTYSKFLDTAVERAKKLGTTVSDVITASADFARLGYTLDEASALSDAAIVYKNVGDGIKDISTASESIISTMKAFGIEANGAMLIVDKFNEVGNNFAISSKGVGDALLRSASTLAAANNTLDESIALVTAANSTIQDADKVGTALKTVSMFLRAAKTEAEDAGESTKGMANSVSELRKEILSLTGNRVDIQIDENTFKSTYQIMKEISEVWKDLSDLSRANLLEMIGGKRNSNVVMSLIENFSVAEDVIKSTADAAGSAMAENEKYLDSIQGKISKFKATFQELAITLIDTDFVKGIVEIGTTLLGVLNVLAQVIDKIGGLNTVLYSTVSILAVVKAEKISEKLKKVREKLSKILDFADDIPKALSAFKNGFNAAKEAGTGFFESASAGFKSLGATISATQLKAAAIMAVIAAVIVITKACVKAYKESHKSIEELNAEYEELRNKIDSVAKSYRDLKSTSDEVIPRFAELAKGVNKFGENVSLTDEEYAEFLRLNNQIAEMFPEINMGMGSNSNAMLALSYSADTLSDSLYELLEAQRQLANQKIADEMPETLKTVADTDKTYEKKIADLEKRKSELEAFYNHLLAGGAPSVINEDGIYKDSAFESRRRQFYSAFGVSQEVYKDLLAYDENPTIEIPVEGVRYVFKGDEAENIQKNYELADEIIDKQIKNIEKLISANQKRINPVVSAWLQTDFVFHELDDSRQTIAEAMVKGLDFKKLGLTTGDEVKNYINDNIVKPLYDAGEDADEAFSKIEQWKTALKSGEMSYDDFHYNILEAFESLRDSMSPDIIDEFTNNFINGFNQIGISGDSFIAVLQNLISEWSGVEQAMQDSSSPSVVINKFSGIIDVLKSASDEYSTMGSVSSEVYKNVIALNKDYADLFDFTNGKIELQSDKVKELVDKLLQEYGARLAANGATEEEISLLSALGTMFKRIVDDTTVTIDSIQKFVDILGDAKNGTTYNAIEIYKLIDQYPDLVSCIRNTTDGYILEAEAIRKVIAAKAALLRTNGSEASKAIKYKLDNNANTKSAGETVDRIFTENESINSVIDFMNEFGEEFNKRLSEAEINVLKEYVNSKIIDQTQAHLFAEIANQLETNPDSFITSKKKTETEFERRYKYHQHMLAMEQESVEDYLNWLGQAYQSAYKSGMIELDDYYKYQEEIYDKTKDLFNDRLSDLEHSIYLSQKNRESDTREGAERIIGIYRDMQSALHEQAEKYRALGLDENSDYIQELQKQWWNYEETIRQLRQDAFNNYLNDNKFHIEQLKIDNANASEISQSYGVILKAINDEIEYYTSKGFDAADDVVQELIKEAHSLRDEVISSLNDIVSKAQSAIDNLQNAYTALSDTAEEYAEYGYVTVDSLQNVINCGVEYMALLQDENGQLVISKENIQNVIAARTEQLAVESALSYVEQLRLALADGNTTELQRLLAATASATNATWGLVYANLALLKLDNSQYEAALNNINALRSLADNAISNIGVSMSGSTQARSEMLREQKEALDSILDYTMELIKWEAEQQVEALEKQVSDYKKIIDLKKELLKATKEEASYEDELESKIKAIAKLQERINALSLDDSRDAQAKRISLEEELADLQKELTDYQADHMLEKHEETLDNMADAYSDEKEKEIEAVKETVSSTEKIYQLAIQRINSDWNGLYQDLLDYNYEYGNKLQEELVSAWNAASLAVQEYGGYVQAVSGITAAMNAVGGANSIGSGANSLGSTGDYSSDAERGRQVAAQVTNLVNIMKANSAAWWNVSEEGRKELEKNNENIAAQISALLGEKLFRGSDGVWYLGSVGSNRRLYDCYHEGGIVGSSPSMKKNETLALLEKGEMVLTDKHQNSLYQLVNFTTTLSEKFSKLIDNVGYKQLFPRMNAITAEDLAAITENKRVNIEFGDVYITGTNNETVEKHREINRQFVNDVLNQLNIKR